MAQRKFLDLTGLQNYDKKKTQQIDDKIAAGVQSAKDYADSKDDQFEAAGSVATAKTELETKIKANTDAISAINNEETGILKQAKDYTDGKDSSIQVAKSAADAAQATADEVKTSVGTVPEGTTVMDIIENIQENAYDDTAIRGLISGLDTNKADKTQVAKDIEDAVKVETDARIEAISGVQGEVNAIKGDYLKASDKEELEGKIALKADKTVLDEVSGVANAAATKVELKAEEDRAKGEEARIEGLVTAEADRAKGVEADFKSRIEAMEVFWDTTEDADGVVNKLKEIQIYIASDESGAATMAGNIQTNTQAIAAMDEVYKAADETLQGNIDELAGVVDTKAAQSDLEALEGRMDDAEGAIEAVEGRVGVAEGKITTLEGKMTTVEGAVATKAEAQTLADAVSALEGVDAGLDERLQLVEAQLGDGENSVSDLIAAAEQRAKDAAAEDATTKANKALEDAKKYADDEDAKIEARVEALESASATHATKTELEGVAGRVTTVEGKVSTLESEMDAVEKKASDNESAIGTINTELAKKAAQTDLEAAVARISANETEIAKKANDADLDDAIERIAKNEEDIAKHTSDISALQSSVASFVRIENSEIDALFS